MDTFPTSVAVEDFQETKVNKQVVADYEMKLIQLVMD